MTSITQLREDLKRLARLAANISEAHTCALFLPTGLLTASGGTGHSSGALGGTIELKTVVQPGAHAGAHRSSAASVELVAVHSLSTNIVRDCRIQVGSGLLGWVAEHGRPIHIAPFDMDSSSIGLYTDTEALKSLVALPVSMPTEHADVHKGNGVLMCDSRKAFSFTKLQVKHLEDLAAEVSRLLFWALFKRETTTTETSWESFIVRAEQLAGAIGLESIEVLRVTLDSYADLEQRAGTTTAVQQSEQFVRLVQQALPPHFPMTRLPDGDLLVAVDNMMSAFFQTKIRTLADHISDPAKPFSISIRGYAARSGRSRGLDIDAILQQRPAVVKSVTQKAVGGARA